LGKSIFHRDVMKLRVIYIVIVTFFLLGLCGPATADVLTPGTPETQGFSVQTLMDLVGTATQQDEVTWRMSSEVLDANEEMGMNQAEFVGVGGDWNLVAEEWVYSPGTGQFVSFPYPDLPPGTFFSFSTPEPPLNPAGEVQMSDAYSENTIADQGVITYTKSMDIETGYQPADLQNIEATRIFTFQGGDIGRAVSEEETTLDTAGTATVLLGFDPYDCPFAGSLGNCYPPFCNIVQSGSSIDMTRTSLSSSLGARTVGEYAYGPDEKWPPLPQVDTAPVALDYRVRVTGIDPDLPALGSVTAYIRAHIQDGGQGCPARTGKAQDILYSEETTADGTITLFDKIIRYESGLTRFTT
jgi:hypothetical protein